MAASAFIHHSNTVTGIILGWEKQNKHNRNGWANFPSTPN